MCSFWRWICILLPYFDNLEGFVPFKMVKTEKSQEASYEYGSDLSGL